MTVIPFNLRNEFLAYLSDFVKKNPDYLELFAERAPKEVEYHDVESFGKNRNYTIITFNDNIALIIPDVYSEFMNARNPSPGPKAV